MRYKFLSALLFLILTLSGCGKKASEGQPAQKPNGAEMNKILTAAEIQALIEKAKAAPVTEVAEDEVAVIETDLGRIVLEFYPKVAPGHCSNFKRLANAGFYDGVKFHRVLAGFVIQGGDILTRDANPQNDGTGNPGYTIPAEFNNIPHDRGILSMARSGHPDSGGSQFFICVGAPYQLNGQYTVFGRVIEGMEVADQIVAAAKNVELPPNAIVMNKVKMVKRNEL